MLCLKYILFDLEFNSGKNKLDNSNLNEIIEIGAVKLDDSLNEIDSFSTFIYPAITQKLNSHVKKLTNITDIQLKGAPDFADALDDFKKWCFSDDVECIFSSWSNTDLFVLLENYHAHFNKDRIGFIKQYFDMQKFVTRMIDRHDHNQVSLKNAAENFGINTDSFSMHRARDDSRVCAELFRKTYSEKALKGYVNDTSGKDYYKRMTYKPHYITDINDKNVDRRLFSANCPYCRKPLRPLGKAIQKYSGFLLMMSCDKCKRKFMLQIKIRMLYDSVESKKKLREIIPEEKKIEPKTTK